MFAGSVIDWYFANSKTFRMSQNWNESVHFPVELDFVKDLAAI